MCNGAVSVVMIKVERILYRNPLEMCMRVALGHRVMMQFAQRIWSESKNYLYRYMLSHLVLLLKSTAPGNALFRSWDCMHKGTPALVDW